MESYEIRTDFTIEPELDRVLPAMECTRNNPVFPRIEALFYELKNRLPGLIHPLAAVKFGALPKRKEIPCAELEEAAYVLYTLGDTISDHIGELFLKGEFLEGMLLETMADDYLLQMEESSHEFLRKALKKRGRGAALRLEAPKDIPMECQRDILKEIKKSVFVPVTITDGFMYDPEKTMSYILLLTEDEKVYEGAHSCETCDRTDCRLRKKEVAGSSD